MATRAPAAAGAITRMSLVRLQVQRAGVGVGVAILLTAVDSKAKLGQDDDLCSLRLQAVWSQPCRVPLTRKPQRRQMVGDMRKPSTKGRG